MPEPWASTSDRFDASKVGLASQSERMKAVTGRNRLIRVTDTFFLKTLHTGCFGSAPGRQPHQSELPSSISIDRTSSKAASSLQVSRKQHAAAPAAAAPPAAKATHRSPGRCHGRPRRGRHDGPAGRRLRPPSPPRPCLRRLVVRAPPCFPGRRRPCWGAAEAAAPDAPDGGAAAAGWCVRRGSLVLWIWLGLLGKAGKAFTHIINIAHAPPTPPPFHPNNTNNQQASNRIRSASTARAPCSGSPAPCARACWRSRPSRPSSPTTPVRGVCLCVYLYILL